MIPYIMMSMAIGVGGSFLAGISEMSFLGSYLSQSPVDAIFTLVATWNSEGFIKAMLFGFTHFTEVLGSFLNALAFNYAVFGNDPITGDSNIIGLTIRIILIAVVTFPVFYGFFTEVVPRFLPWGKG